MAKIIGLTSGIGSGKTTVAEMFRVLGVPVYYADHEAKNILFTPQVAQLVKETLGESVFTDGIPDRAKIASVVFSYPQKLAQLNAIIHPRVAEHFKQWTLQHVAAPFVIKEAAILFESGASKQCDAVILVTAPVETRIARVMARDGVTREMVLKRMANQWTDEQKMGLSKYIITNIEPEDTKKQVLATFDFLNIIEN